MCTWGGMCFFQFVNQMFLFCWFFFLQNYVLALYKQTSSLVHTYAETKRTIWNFLTNTFKCVREFVRACVRIVHNRIEFKICATFIFKMKCNFCNSSQANCRWFSYKLDGTHFVWLPNVVVRCIMFIWLKCFDYKCPPYSAPAPIRSSCSIIISSSSSTASAITYSKFLSLYFICTKSYGILHQRYICYIVRFA